MRDDSTDTIRLTELFCARDEEALRETARLYEPLCMHIALNILADRQMPRNASTTRGSAPGTTSRPTARARWRRTLAR